MNELDCQSLIVKAVRDGGGFAFKLANRFLVGIPDLFICSPEYGTSLWEVKFKAGGDWLIPEEGGLPRFSVTEKVSVTAKQRQKMEAYTHAGGFCGVVSFYASSDLRAAFIPWQLFSYGDAFTKPGRVALAAYTVLPRGKREQTIRELLVKAHYAKDKNFAPLEPQVNPRIEEIESLSAAARSAGPRSFRDDGR